METRQSAKEFFMRRVFSSVLDYMGNYEVFQFAYDFWLWTTIGGAKGSVQAPLRLVLSGRPFSPEFWRWHHLGLIDVQRQLG